VYSDLVDGIHLISIKSIKTVIQNPKHSTKITRQQFLPTHRSVQRLHAPVRSIHEDAMAGKPHGQIGSVPLQINDEIKLKEASVLW
jgi:hypothetical protein